MNSMSNLGVVDQQLLETANRKQQNTDNVLLLVENCDIKLEIFNKSTHLNQSETQITVMSKLFFCEGYSLVHVIITTIIIFCMKYLMYFLPMCFSSTRFDRWKNAIVEITNPYVVPGHVQENLPKCKIHIPIQKCQRNDWLRMLNIQRGKCVSISRYFLL